ncbi:hypothetical protein KUCAC02_023450, partial [Chaenocephalus aceratus]
QPKLPALARRRTTGELKAVSDKRERDSSVSNPRNLAWPLITVQGPLTVLQREHGPPPGRSLSPGDDCRNTCHTRGGRRCHEPQFQRCHANKGKIKDRGWSRGRTLCGAQITASAKFWSSYHSNNFHVPNCPNLAPRLFREMGVCYQRETLSQACHVRAGFDLDGSVTVWARDSGLLNISAIAAVSVVTRETSLMDTLVIYGRELWDRLQPPTPPHLHLTSCFHHHLPLSQQCCALLSDNDDSCTCSLSAKWLGPQRPSPVQKPAGRGCNRWREVGWKANLGDAYVLRAPLGLPWWQKKLPIVALDKPKQPSP